MLLFLFWNIVALLYLDKALFIYVSFSVLQPSLLLLTAPKWGKRSSFEVKLGLLPFTPKIFLPWVNRPIMGV